jgi:hypothetical protein
MRRLLVLSLLFASTGCWRWGWLPCLCGSALATAAVVSATPPPAPPPQPAPPPRPGGVWQPGYWSLQNNQWVWIPGQWVAAQPGFAWQPSHWEQAPDGTWHLVEGRWVPMQ